LTPWVAVLKKFFVKVFCNSRDKYPFACIYEHGEIMIAITRNEKDIKGADTNSNRRD
jgi:hypothetical protein